jgi:hypothetical protein
VTALLSTISRSVMALFCASSVMQIEQRSTDNLFIGWIISSAKIRLGKSFTYSTSVNGGAAPNKMFLTLICLGYLVTTTSSSASEYRNEYNFGR